MKDPLGSEDASRKLTNRPSAGHVPKAGQAASTPVGLAVLIVAVKRLATMAMHHRDQEAAGYCRVAVSLRPDNAGAYEGLDRILVLPWNDRYTSEHVRYIADSIALGVSELRRAAA